MTMDTNVTIVEGKEGIGMSSLEVKINVKDFKKIQLKASKSTNLKSLYLKDYYQRLKLLSTKQNI